MQDHTRMGKRFQRREIAFPVSVFFNIGEQRPIAIFVVQKCRDALVRIKLAERLQVLLPEQDEGDLGFFVAQIAVHLQAVDKNGVARRQRVFVFSDGNAHAAPVYAV